MDAAKHLEIEIKFALKNPEETLLFLQNNGTFLKESFQKDTYFLPSHKNYLEKKPITEWLRIRESDNGHSINYKNWAVKEWINENYCDEYEIHIDMPEDAKNIFGVLQIKPIVIVNKRRKLFTYKNIEIALDEVDELGRFIEFEAKGEFISIEEARDYLYKIANEMWTKLEDQDKKWYPYVLLEKKGVIT